MKSIMHLVARAPWYIFVGFCVTATVLILVLLDWSVEQYAWFKFSAAGMSTLDIVLSIALAWLLNVTFWTWVLIAGVGSTVLWHLERKKQKDYSNTEPHIDGKLESTKATNLKGKQLWHWLLTMIPLWSAYNASNQYSYVDGMYQKLPFSLENGLIGFFSGIVLSGVLYAIGFGITHLIKIIRSRTSDKD